MTGADGIRWEEPSLPAVRNRRSAAQEVVAALKSNPGRWARLREYDHASYNTAQAFASLIRLGRSPVYAPAGAFEARSVSVEGGYAVYARYVGEVAS